MQDEVVARGKRVIIRRRRIADATDEYDWRADVELCRYDAVPPVNVNFADYLRGWRLNFYLTDAGQRSFALEDETGRHIGNVMYYNINSGRGEAELGISVGAKHRWGLGYGSDALAAMLGFVFRNTSLNWIYVRTLDWNLRAQRCFHKAGFRECNTSWQNGHSFVIMRIRREQWRERLSSARRPSFPHAIPSTADLSGS